MNTLKPPDGLFESIVNRIHEERRILVLRRRIILFCLGFVVSAAAFIPAWKWLAADLSNSGFLQFFSLLFSDFKIVATYWQNFLMSLLETVPAMSLAVFLAAVFVFLESLNFLAKNIKFIFSSKQLTNI